MNEKIKKDELEEEIVEETAKETDDVEENVEELADEEAGVSKLEEDYLKLKDDYIRLYAEMENMKKRTHAETEKTTTLCRHSGSLQCPAFSAFG